MHFARLVLLASSFLLFTTSLLFTGSVSAQRRVATPVSRARVAQLAAQREVHRTEIEGHVDTIQDRNAVDGQRGRGFHHAGIAAVEVEYRPAARNATVRGMLQNGALARGRRGVVRFSHGRPEGDPQGGRRDQRSPDVRGAALELDGQALTFTNQRAQIVSTGVEFLRLFNELGAPGSRVTLPSRLAQRIGTGTLLRALPRLAIGAAPIDNLLTAQYWGPPTVVGANEAGDLYIARATLIPIRQRSGTGTLSRIWQGIRNSRLFNRNPNYLTDGAAAGLENGLGGFHLALQFYQDDVSTPLELDGDKVWNAPVHIAGEVHPTSRTLLTGEQLQAIEQRGNFGPQVIDRTVAAPAEGVGHFQADRNIAYRRSAANRLQPPRDTNDAAR